VRRTVAAAALVVGPTLTFVAALDRLPAAAEVTSPAPAGSMAPQLVNDAAGNVILSWLEPSPGNRHRFSFAVRAKGRWTAARTIAEEDRVFANWADVPAIAVLSDGTWAAHWLSATGRGSYDVKVSTSRDRGHSWSAPIVPHRDGTLTEHGFASLGTWPGGSLGMVWLDGRDYAGHGPPGMHTTKGQMALRGATFRDGKLADEWLVDPRVCDCCPTALARTNRGVVVAYRDRSEQEVRDISIVRYESGRWLAPARVHADDWAIGGCPVNGPALASHGDRVAIAWFSAAADVARVNVALSQDAGATFGAPVRVDDGLPEGRVDLLMDEDGSVLVTWIERAAGGWELRMRRVDARGDKSDAVTVTRVSANRSSGYPRIAAARNELVFAWTDGRVKTAVAPRTLEPRTQAVRRDETRSVPE
jgi:hypothetical protein